MTSTGDAFDGLVSGGGTRDKKKSGGDDMSDLVALKAAAARVRGTLVPPGQVHPDVAADYMSKIANLFSGVDRTEIDMALFAWGALNGTGSETNYAQALPIEAGGKKVEATRVFGTILPVNAQGIPRKVFSTYFEKKAAVYLEVLPEIGDMLRNRAARAGIANAAPLLLIDFVKGVSAATAGDGMERQSVKDTLLSRRGKRITDSGSVQTVPKVDLGAERSGRGGLY